MFPDLDKSSEFIARKSFNEDSLDICDEDTLSNSALYEDLMRKQDNIDKQRYTISSVKKGRIVNIRQLLPFDGEEFVKMAYMAILGREPEKSALISFQATFATDNSRNVKINYLKAMGLSEEAKLRGTVLTGYDSIDVKEFYKYSDRELIEKAYISILFRKPDSEGENHFLSYLRSSEYSATEILYMLRHSSEGEKNGVNIVGLDEEYTKRMKRKKLMSIPVIGRCVKYIGGLSRVNRKIENLKNENYYLRDKLYSWKLMLDGRTAQLTQRIDVSEKRTAGLLKAMESRLSELDAVTRRLDDNVNELLKSYKINNEMISKQATSITELSKEFDRTSISCENSIRELDAYTHQIGNNVTEINKALSNYDGILSEYVREDKKNLQLLLAEAFSLKSRLNALENSTERTADKSSSNTYETCVVPVSNVYSSIDYFDFENHFRGSREHVKNVQRVYIPYFEGKKNVLDLGCGRGEFTELLRENDIGVTGVDMYEPYVEYVKALGLPVVLDDAISYLSSQKSTDGIFLGQVVEHISVDQIVTICNMAYEKLEEGCCLIMETPNPRSLAMYYNAFYIDPSHQKPVHPYALKYIAEKSGFSDVRILYTDTSKVPFSIPKIQKDDPDYKEFNAAMQRVSELLFGSQDYSVIARK